MAYSMDHSPGGLHVEPFSTQSPHLTRDKLVADFKQVITSAEELLNATANQSGDAIAQARSRAESTLHDARRKLAELEHEMVDEARRLVANGEQQIKEHPWAAVGVGAGVGLLLGMLISRR
jgi:ElaB/YqjD/DUF883 family membrane-anchored ribosome-binding protein